MKKKPNKKQFNLDLSDAHFKQIGEKQLDNGDWEYTFEVDKWVDDLLKKKYGKEDYSDDLSKAFNDYLKEMIVDDELVEKIKKEYKEFIKNESKTR